MHHVTVFGLGRVGLPVAVTAVEQGFEVSGVDVSEERIADIESGRTPWRDLDIPTARIREVTATTDPSTVVPRADVILVCVPTPLDSNYAADLSNIESVFEAVSESITPETLVIIESTVPPGTTEAIGRGTIENNSEVDLETIRLAHCPERIDPGNDEWPLHRIPRVLGGLDDESAAMATAFYEELLEAPIHRVANARTAACTKIVENAFRDVNIAFVNELARYLGETNIDVYEVLDGAATKPYGYMKFTPGPGVGGHCIPVDPYMLINQAKQTGHDHEFLELARRINDGMPDHIVSQCQDVLNEIGLPVKGTQITQLGLSFKGGIGDTRSSPASSINSELTAMGASVETYDPYLLDESTVDSPYVDADLVLLLTDHLQFDDLEPERLARHGVRAIYDARNVLDGDEVVGTGLVYANLAGMWKPT